MKNKVINNASWIIGFKLLKAFLMLLVTILTARYLGSSNYGLINYAASLTMFFSPLMKLGIDSIIVYEMIKEPDEEGEILGTAMVLNVLSAVVCIILIYGFTLLFQNDQETIWVCLLYSVSMIFQGASVIQYWFQSKLLSKYTSMGMVISYFVATVYQIIVLINHGKIYWFAMTNTIDYFILMLFLICIYKKKSNQSLKFNKEIAKKLLSKGKYYILSTMMVTIFTNTDTIMLKLLLNNEAVGVYSAAFKCAIMSSFIFVALIDSSRPLLFELGKKSIEEFEKKLALLYAIIIYLSVLFSILVSCLSPTIIRIMFGEAYTGSVNILRVLIWLTTFSYIGTIRDIWILVEHKQSLLWKINMIGAISNIILNYWFINKFGTIGAAFSSLITQIFTNFILGFILKDLKRNNQIMMQAFTSQSVIGVIDYLKNIKR